MVFETECVQFLERDVISFWNVVLLTVEIGPCYNSYNQKLYEKLNNSNFRTSVCYFLSQTFVFFCLKIGIVRKGDCYENKNNEFG